MRLIGLVVCLVLALGAFAQEKEPAPVSADALFNQLAAAVGPSRCVRVGEFDGAPGWGDLWIQRVRYRVVENGVLKIKDAVIAAEAKGLPEENARWLEDVPDPLKEAPVAEADPLGTDEEILTAVGGVVLKAEIERHAVVGDSLPSATVAGYREVDGKPTEFKVVVYNKGGVLVSSEPVDKATAAAAAEVKTGAIDNGQWTMDNERRAAVDTGKLDLPGAEMQDVSTPRNITPPSDNEYRSPMRDGWFERMEALLAERDAK